MQVPTMAICHVLQMPLAVSGQALASPLGQTVAQRVALGPARTTIPWCPCIPGIPNTPCPGEAPPNDHNLIHH